MKKNMMLHNKGERTPLTSQEKNGEENKI